jgi:hypothetical protein
MNYLFDEKDGENSFLTYLATGEYFVGKIPIRTPDKFIEYMDEVIHKIDEFPLDMEPSKGPNADEILQKYIDSAKN